MNFRTLTTCESYEELKSFVMSLNRRIFEELDYDVNETVIRAEAKLINEIVTKIIDIERMLSLKDYDYNEKE